MPTNLPKVVARFETTLASSYSSGNATFNIASGTDANGDVLSGYYGVTIDGGTANEQFDVVTISGTTCTVVVRDCKPSDPTASRSRTMPTHRKGSSVKVTDYSIIAFLRGLANGDLSFDTVLKYTTEPSFTDRKQIIDKGYADDIIVGAVPTASTSVAGTVKISTASGTPTAVETGDPRVPTANQTAAAAGDNTSIAVGSGNKFVTQTGLQNKAETYATSTGSANAYVLTLSPIPTALVAGQEFEFKANFANTGAATLNVNSLGAIAIKKTDGATALVSGDIANGLIVKVKYDGTNFQMLSPIGQGFVGSFASPYTTTSSNTTQNVDTIFTTTFTPKIITLYFSIFGVDGVGNKFSNGIAIFNGTSLIGSFITTNNQSSSTAYAPNLSASIPSAGASGGGGQGSVTLSIINVTATGFTVRAAYAVGASPPTPTGNFIAVATA